MKAAVLKKFGQPLAIEVVSKPVPGPGQILVQVAACGVCHTDVHLALGEWESFKNLMSLPLVLGHEVAGRVAGVGPAVTRFCEGDPVGVSWFHHTCGQCTYCLQDLEVFCDVPTITGATVNGGFAEYLLAWESHSIPIPEGFPLSEAAPLFCAGGTVFSALSKVDLKESDHLAVWGVGGLGHFAVQLARRSGARITAVDLVPSKLKLAKELGADVTVLASQATEWFGEAENKVGIALVCADSVEAYQGALQSLRKNGILLVVGLPSHPLVLSAGDLVRAGTRVVPSRVCSRQELRELFELAAAGVIDSRIHRYRLEQINEVMAFLADGSVSGRAVIEFE